VVELPAFLRDAPDGCAITLKVHPRARRRGVVGPVGDALKVEVTAPPAEGAANAEVEALIAELLGVSKRQVAVTHGATSRRKTVVVKGITAAEAAGLLAR